MQFWKIYTLYQQLTWHPLKSKGVRPLLSQDESLPFVQRLKNFGLFGKLADQMTVSLQDSPRRGTGSSRLRHNTGHRSPRLEMA